VARRPPAASPIITTTDLRAYQSPADLFTLFRKLGYPVESPVALPIDPDALPGALRDGIAARYSLAIIGGARPGDPRLEVTLFVLRPTEKIGPMALARSIAQINLAAPGAQQLNLASPTPRLRPLSPLLSLPLPRSRPTRPNPHEFRTIVV
jgi:hypothetical protein